MIALPVLASGARFAYEANRLDIAMFGQRASCPFA